MIDDPTNAIPLGEGFDFDPSRIPAGMDVFQALGLMPETQRAELSTRMNEMFESLGENMITQMAVGAVKAEYEALGMDAGKIQRDYILRIGGIMLFLLGVSIEGNPLEINWTVQALLSLAYLSIIASALAFFLLYWLLRQVKVTTVTSMALVHPLVAVFAGWIVLNETLGWTVMLGTGAVLSGLFLILIRASPHTNRAPE